MADPEALTEERPGEGGGRRGDEGGAGHGHPDETPDKQGGKQGGEEGGEEGKLRRRWPLYALAVLVVVAAIAGGIWWWLTRNDVSTDDAFTDGRAVMMAPHVSGYVTELAVTDNQFVHRGDLLIQIDPRDYIAARDQAEGALTVALAQLVAAQAALDKARVEYPARKVAADAEVESARAQLVRAERDDRRQQSVAPGATTQQQRDMASTALRQAQASLRQAEAQAAQAALVAENIRQAEDQVAQLQGDIQRARAQLAQAELNLSWTRVVAPSDGWVTKRNVERGALVQSGSPILSLVAPETWITANFKEGQLARMRPGQKVDVTVDAYPKLHLKAHVDSVQMGSGAVFSAFPAENATGNFVKIVRRVPVKIVIDSGLDDGPLPLGLSVLPTVHVE